MELIFGLLVALFWPVLIIVGVIWLIKKLTKPPTTQYISTGVESTSVAASNSEWEIRKKVSDEIRAQSVQYKSAAQKQVVEEMALTVEYFANHSYVQQVTEQQLDTNFYQEDPLLTVATDIIPSVEQTVEYETPWKKLQLLDSVTILLYLGAFLLLASIGLYVGFGSGAVIKAVLSLIITLVFYVAGLQLFERTTRLRPAGLTFVAIGMATLPMAGAATYFYGFEKSNGPAVWLATSIIGLFMYVFALLKLKSPLISYIVVFSSLSVVLSSISSLGLAPYYFIQGLGVSGLIFLFVSQLFTKNDTGIKEAYAQSSTFFVPFSIGMSVLFVSKVGWIQLALSLLVGTLYYAYMAFITAGKKPVYPLLAQLMLIPSIISGVYGLGHNAMSVRVLLCLMVGAYMFVWLTWASVRIKGDEYRNQIKSILLGLPLVAVISFILSAHVLWVGLLAMTLAGMVVYIKDRDTLSGIEWATGILLLPVIIGLLGFDPELSASLIGVAYIVVLAVSVVLGIILKFRMMIVDRVLLQSILVSSVIAGALFQFRASNSTQITVAIIEVLLLTLASWFAVNAQNWFSITASLYAIWLVAYLDNFKILAAMIAGFLVYNIAIAQLKVTSFLHSWYASFSLLALPAIYGLLARDNRWGSKDLWIAYGILTILFVVMRATKRIITPTSTVFGYIVALVILLSYAYSISPSYGLWTSFAAMVLMYFYEWLTKNSLYGYIAPLVPLTLLFDIVSSSKLILLMVVILTSVLLVASVVRRRSYEAYLAIVGLLVLPWYAGTIVYGWSNYWVCAIYLVMSGLMILVRQLLKSTTWSVTFKSVCIFGYVPALLIGTLYGAVCGWRIAVIVYFISGLLFTAISYVESSPVVIVLAFIMGYVSLLRYTTGLELSINYTVSILLALSQSTYWALVISKLQTVRSQYARGFQICVGLIIPLIGFGYPLKSIFPLALALFGGMLLNELWLRGQAFRETGILIIHVSLLWWLYTLGVRELQVYSQSTAALIGIFAYWRRMLKDTPAVINQYLWTAVLIFSLPMVWQAVSSSNIIYAYLVLVEHVVLILISIAFKRATFAWWGIAVVVASVLYQLRKLRYAALAFLGAFIIALAVYFLLKYNKPEQSQK